MYDLEKEMCEAIAKHTPFSADEVFAEWLNFKSFDLILRAVEFARSYGFVSISRAIAFLVDSYISESAKNTKENK